MARSPEPLEGFVADVLASVARRRKSLKHRVRKLSVERILEREGDDERRRLDIVMEPRSSRTLVRISVWEDRWVSVEASRWAKDNRWSYVNGGRLLGGLGGRGLVVAIEASVNAAHDASRGRVESFNEVWVPILASGPRPL